MKFYESPAYSEWCKRVYGFDLKQMGMITMSELELFFNEVKLPPMANILDVGCCAGNMSDYISKHYNAYVTGIDIDQAAINYAKERFATNKYLSFQVMDLNELQFESNSFDVIYWFDTLYFTRSIVDLRSALDKSMKILKPDGKLVVFWVNFPKMYEMPEPSADNTQVGIWCNDNNIKFQSFDLTTQIRNFYNQAIQTLHDLEAQLMFEIPEHCISMLQEFSEMAEMCEKGDESGIYRWLYIIKGGRG